MDSLSVVQPWLAQYCTLKMQSVLLLGLRGCDGMPKEDTSKILSRALRSMIFIDADIKAGATESAFTHHALTEEILEKLADDLDHYLVHWVAHVMHPAEIIGYKYPDPYQRQFWLGVYVRLVAALHLLPESEAHLDIRLADKPFGKTERAAYQALPTNIRILERVQYIDRPVERKGYVPESIVHTETGRSSGYKG